MAYIQLGKCVELEAAFSTLGHVWYWQVCQVYTTPSLLLSLSLLMPFYVHNIQLWCHCLEAYPIKRQFCRNTIILTKYIYFWKSNNCQKFDLRNLWGCWRPFSDFQNINRVPPWMSLALKSMFLMLKMNKQKFDRHDLWGCWRIFIDFQT